MLGLLDNFKTIFYRFGDNEDIVLFQRLTQYISAVDVDDILLSEKYTIKSGERPDTLSYKTYGKTDYYWTFYLVNEHLRESGWPLPSYDLLDEAKKKYPHRTVTTNTNISKSFPVGQKVSGLFSGTEGTIIRRIPDMGQLIIDTGTEKFTQNETIKYNDGDGNLFQATVLSDVEQYNSVHHYEDADGVHQDLTLFDFGNPSSFWTKVSYFDRLNQKNDELKEIDIVSPRAIEGLVTQFQRLMKTQ
jgi:hypothetical protein